MAAPDHWVTLSIMGRTKQWTTSKVFKTSLVTAVGHVGLSLALGAAVATVGIVFSQLISGYLDTGIGSTMVVAGLIVGLRPFVTRRTKEHNYGHAGTHEHSYDHNEHDHDHGNHHYDVFKSEGRNVGYFAAIGAALSPDPTIIPIFLGSIPAGFYFLFEIAAIFAVTSILTLVFLVRLGSMGFAKALEKIPERYNDSIVGFVIAAIGVFILVTPH